MVPCSHKVAIGDMRTNEYDCVLNKTLFIKTVMGQILPLDHGVQSLSVDLSSTFRSSAK